MILGIGIDVVEVPRMKRLLAKNREPFIQKVFTQQEREDCSASANADVHVQRFAGRFAAKEAFLKAVGTGLAGGLSWRDVEVRNDGQGKPTIHLYHAAFEKIRNMKADSVHVSISHTRTVAVAVVILENNSVTTGTLKEE